MRVVCDVNLGHAYVARVLTTKMHMIGSNKREDNKGKIQERVVDDCITDILSVVGYLRFDDVFVSRIGVSNSKLIDNGKRLTRVDTIISSVHTWFNSFPDNLP